MAKYERLEEEKTTTACVELSLVMKSRRDEIQPS
jgi:hypothetical protein